MKPYFDAHHKAVETEVKNGVPEDLVFVPTALIRGIGCFMANRGSSEYDNPKTLNHSNKQIPGWAERALPGDEPPSKRPLPGTWISLCLR
jgi:hypothetical protein